MGHSDDYDVCILKAGARVKEGVVLKGATLATLKGVSAAEEQTGNAYGGVTPCTWRAVPDNRAAQKLSSMAHPAPSWSPGIQWTCKECSLSSVSQGPATSVFSTMHNTSTLLWEIALRVREVSVKPGAATMILAHLQT
jgi:hypothetical protein